MTLPQIALAALVTIQTINLTLLISASPRFYAVFPVTSAITLSQSALGIYLLATSTVPA
jgi:hypothetical protein